MHRVLSFQMARGFGESSEFVTKRMCFSFLFCVGFLSLLCGFVTGRFAAARAIDFRAEKTRIQLAENGLESNEHVRQFLLRQIRENSFIETYVTERRNEDDVQRIKDTLLDLQFFHRVVGNRSCIAATLRGSHEPDRYIIVSAIGEGVTTIMELSKALKASNEEFDWNPRRTIIFMISLESSEACHDFLGDYSRARVVGYIELNVRSISANGYFVTTGSDIVRSNILQASREVENPNNKNQLGESPTATEGCREIVCVEFVPQRNLDTPNAIITFAIANNSSIHNDSTEVINVYRRAIGEIIGTTVWRLSEMTLFKWDPEEDDKIFMKTLESLDSSESYRKIMETLVGSVEKLSKNIAIFNEKIEHMETTKSLEVRRANDLSMQVRRLILCNERDSRLRVDWLIFRKNNNASTSTIENYLRTLSLCYETANELLEEDIT